MSLPHRFTEASFRRYEPFIREMIKRHPATFKIKPTGINAETFSCRFRDAITAFFRYKYSSDIVPEILTTVWNDFQVTHDGIHVTIGRKPSKLVDVTGTVTAGQQTSASNELQVERPKATDEVVTAFLTIYKNGALEVPTRFLSYVPSPQVESLLPIPGVETFDNNGDWIMM